MTFPRLTVWLGLTTAIFAARLAAGESNVWPGPVTQTDASGKLKSWNALGPLLFDEPAPDGERVSGFRPLYVRRTAATGETAEVTVLYPFFYWRGYGESYEWSIFKLINRYTRKDGLPPAPDRDDQTFDLWPFYFSRSTGIPETTYHALLPVGGSMQGRLGYDRLSWVLFPLFVQSEKNGAITTDTPWPIIRVTRGAEHGFAIWPLFGHDERPDAFLRQFWLWPLGWNNTLQAGPDKPAGTPPTRQVGALPFYAAEHGPDKDWESFGPFFGFIDRRAPYRYHETDYFWPFLVQGRGDRYVNRWGPFYTHSVIEGMDKTWSPWPLLRRAHWTEEGVAQTKTQLLYFIFWRLEQRSMTNPAAAPAEKTYLWPFFSSWDNGAGRRQFQFLSPLEGVFADNPDVRMAWSPLFALARYDQRAPGEERTSLLWNAVTWERNAAEGRAEFHLGPLLSMVRRPEGRRWALGNGLVGLKRSSTGGGWRLFWLEFPSKQDKVSTALR